MRQICILAGSEGTRNIWIDRLLPLPAWDHSRIHHDVSNSALNGCSRAIEQDVWECTTMSIVIDSEKGTKVGRLPYHSFATVGTHGHKDMPEDITSTGVERGFLGHMLFITLTISVY